MLLTRSLQRYGASKTLRLTCYFSAEKVFSVSMIEKTSTGKYRVRVDMGRDRHGKRLRNTKTVPTMREARALEHMWAEMARTDAVIRDHMRFDDFVIQYYLPDKEKHLRYNTVRRYKLEIKKRLLPAFSHKYLEDIKQRDIQTLLDSCDTRNMAKVSRDVLRQILNMAMKYGYVKQNVAALTYDFPERAIRPEDHNGTWLTSFEQHDEFIEKIDNQLFKTVCVLGLSLGLRKGEIFGLDWEDIDLDHRVVHVKQTYVMEDSGYKLMAPKTAKSDRYIPLRYMATEYLKDLYESRGEPTGAVVINKYGHRASPNKCAERWTEYLQKHDLEEVSILNMRHSFATACVNAGMDIVKVSRMLGHTQISTTVSRYVRYKVDDIQEEFDRLSVGQKRD